MNARAAALLFHAPGLWFFCRRRLNRQGALLNVIALALTLGAAISLALRAGLAAAALAFGVGHVAWSLTLALGLRHLTESDSRGAGGRSD